LWGEIMGKTPSSAMVVSIVAISFSGHREWI
jgi:hypothetical protein